MSKPLVSTLLKDIENLLYNHDEKVNVNLVLAKMYYVLCLLTE